MKHNTTTWLEDALTTIRALSRQHLLSQGTLKGAPTRNTVGLTSNLLALITTVIERISNCEGVSGAFAAQDGLVMEAQGAPLEYEAFAAVSQRVYDVCRTSGDALALGKPGQALISNSEYKLVLFFAGSIAIGIVAPKDANLGIALTADK